jgi:hypothetical protein
MDFRPLASVGLSLAGVLALGITLAWLQRRGWVDTRKGRVRRGAGHAMLGLREFVDPSVEHVIQAEKAEQRAVDDLDSSGVDTEEILADLSTSLGRDPVDHEEVRRHLASARRAGLDWREAYAGAVRCELTARPFRAPSLPPIWKVAPRE